MFNGKLIISKYRFSIFFDSETILIKENIHFALKKYGKMDVKIRAGETCPY